VSIRECPSSGLSAATSKLILNRDPGSAAARNPHRIGCAGV